MNPIPTSADTRLSRRTLITLTGAAMAAPWIGAHAQNKIAGGRPITLIVSYPPGGGADLTCARPRIQ